MAWIDVAERMPALGKQVFVRGRYIPEGTGNPMSYRRDLFNNGKIVWCSNEWRGTVAITHWWEQQQGE
jgi:hypothetical protein